MIALVVATLLQSVLPFDPNELQEVLRGFAGTTTPTAAAIYGGGGLGSFLLVRWILKRRRADNGPEPAPTSVSTTGGSVGGVVKDEAAITLPSFLPVSKGIRKITHNEIHALELGFAVGLVCAWLFAQGRTEPVVTIVVATVAGSLGFRRYSSKGGKTIRMEPWYALLALVVGGGLGWGLFVADPGIIDIVRSMWGTSLPVR